MTQVKPMSGCGAMMKRMHYHYFTLEQRDAIARVIHARVDERGMGLALERLRWCSRCLDELRLSA